MIIVYHCSTKGKLKKLSPRKPKHFARKALYFSPTLKDLASWQQLLSEEKKKFHYYIYELELPGDVEVYTCGGFYGDEQIWERGKKTWGGQCWVYQSLKVKRVYRKKLIDGPLNSL